DELGSLRGAVIAPSPTLEWQFYQFKVEKLAAALAQAFLHFYDTCRFWGEAQRQDPDLVQARLGLVLATQLLLQFLLREGLGLTAPTEL
ncbi:MAG TPA: DALR anticodon-binding domain-containing protein, partial [Allocoleopsis sp.]